MPGVDGVARLEDGRRVYTGALAPYGMMAERTLISPTGAFELPDGVDSVTAAAVPNPGSVRLDVPGTRRRTATRRDHSWCLAPPA